QQGASFFGVQCIVVSIDAKRNSQSTYECVSHSGKVATGRDVVKWAQEVERLGAGEILLTSVEYDGSMMGYDIELIKLVTSAVSIPVIASGGAGNYEHMRQAIQEGKASAVAAASIFHFTEQTPLGAKKHLKQHGIQVRL
ncbi:MAG: imidazole glycerol phosphate synthase cyclase subunit, partial [Candidatus Staskawiczbacteria bacterium]|nr:imidazole glycerol phosphate synthase cyclase subunit [Candidatus Staskawiczbacteria bacterium]